MFGKLGSAFGRLVGKTASSLSSVLAPSARTFAQGAARAGLQYISDPGANRQKLIGEITALGREMLGDAVSRLSRQTIGSVLSGSPMANVDGGITTIEPSLTLQDYGGTGFIEQMPSVGSTGFQNTVQDPDANPIGQRQGAFLSNAMGYSGLYYGSSPLDLVPELNQRQAIGFKGTLPGTLYNTQRGPAVVARPYELQNRAFGEGMKNLQTVQQPVDYSVIPPGFTAPF